MVVLPCPIDHETGAADVVVGERGHLRRELNSARGKAIVKVLQKGEG